MKIRVTDTTGTEHELEGLDGLEVTIAPSAAADAKAA